MHKPEKEYENMLRKLKAICQQKKISQYTLANVTGMSTSSISSLMNGKTKPYIYTVLTICDALGVSIQELFEEQNPNITRGETFILYKYRQLSPPKQKQLEIYVDMLEQYNGGLI